MAHEFEGNMVNEFCFNESNCNIGWSKQELRNMLEDVVNALDLSDEMIEKHGPLGTSPAELVRLVLDRKDREIAMLERGFKRV